MVFPIERTRATLPPRRLCFAHMQKTAGSSAHDFIIKSMRAENSWSEDQYQRIWASDFIPRHFGAIEAGGLRFVYGHFDPTPIFDVFDGIFFTIVRDPVERVLSLYNFCATMDDAQLSAITGVREPAFAEGTPSTFAMATDMISMIGAVSGGLSFQQFIRLPEQLFKGLESWPDFLAYLPTAGSPDAYLNQFDVVGFADDMPGTLRALAKRMCWDPPEIPPHVNRTPRAVVTRDALDRDDFSIIAQRTKFEGRLWLLANQRAGRG